MTDQIPPKVIRGSLIVSPEVASLIDQAKEELYQAIQAIEDGDLPFARSSSQRASGLVIEAWQTRSKNLLTQTES